MMRRWTQMEVSRSLIEQAHSSSVTSQLWNPDVMIELAQRTTAMHEADLTGWNWFAH